MSTTQDPETPEQPNTAEPWDQTPETPPLPSITVNQQVEKNEGGTIIGVNINQPRPIRIPLLRPPRIEHFIGREKEIAQLLQNLQPGSVVTLCGPGGMGKTALASQAVWTLAPSEQPPERFPDGILFHTFYNRPEVAILFEKIAATFGEDLRPSPLDAAQRALASRRILLVLDGAEQADNLRSILEIHDLTCVLITTRSRGDAPALRIDLGPLPPKPSAELLKAWGGEYASVDKAVKEICALVGDLPLAICLAGSYLARTEDTAEQYLSWLKTTPLEALDHGERRGQSVRILLERSLREVSDLARRVIAVCGILAYSPALPQTIAAGLDQSLEELKPAINELLNYGLLHRLESRFQLSHPLIHSYAHQFIKPPEGELSRIVIYYLNSSAASGDKHKSLIYQEAERPHIINVLMVLRERQYWKEIIPLSWLIYDFLDLGGYYTECLMVLNVGLTAARSLEDRVREGGFLVDLGNVYSNLGQIGRAIQYHEQALAIARKFGDRRREEAALGNLGIAYSGLGKQEQAIEYHQQALSISREISDQPGEANHLGNLGNTYYILGKLDQAISFHEQALGISHAIDDRRGEGNWLGGLGNDYTFLGKLEQAINYYQQVLTISREIGDRRMEEKVLGDLGLAYYDLGQVEQAIKYHEKALPISREIGDRRGESEDLGNLGNAYLDLGQVEWAIEYLEQALAISREIGDRRGEGLGLGNLGLAYSHQGQLGLAIEYYQQALAIAVEVRDRRGEANHSWNLGLVYQKLDDLPSAIASMQACVDIEEELGVPEVEADAAKVAELRAKLDQ